MNIIHKSSPQRITTQQQAIFQLVKRSQKHLTADDVYAEVRRTLPRISLATVYRNLEKLVDAGLIGRVSIRGVYYFELNTEAHYHVICLSCKRVEDVGSSQATYIESFFARDTGYILTGHELVLHGVCPVCQKK